MFQLLQLEALCRILKGHLTGRAQPAIGLNVQASVPEPHVLERIFAGTKNF